MAPKHVLLLFLTMSSCKLVHGATFENITIVLKWHAGQHDQSNVIVKSSNSIREYVGQFGEVLIQDQKISSLPPDSISNLQKLTHLQLINCRIEDIAVGAFKTLPLLTDLNLSGNLLKVIRNGVFTNLKFHTLYLENNRIVKIEDQAFNHLQMEYLFIDDNQISVWKSEWFDGTPLQSVSMRNNRLKSLPKLAFEYLWHFNPSRDTTMQNIVFAGNDLTTIDPDAFEGIQMIFSLNLHNNSLRHLEPGLFDHVERLDRVDVSSNLLTEVYFETFRKTRVSQLVLFDNLISCVPTDVFNATRLELLNIGNNPIDCKCVEIWDEWRAHNDKPTIVFTNECLKSRGVVRKLHCALVLVLLNIVRINM